MNPTSANKRPWALGGLIAATTASVVLSISAWAGNEDPAAPRMAPMGMMMQGGHGPAGMFFPGGRHLQHLLDDAKVSDAQRKQIRQITDQVQADLKALHEEARPLHAQGLQIWAAPQIDAAAAEKLRQQMQAHHDKVSKRMLQAMLDVGHVLTPEQRKVVATQMEKHREDMARRMHDPREAHHRWGGHGGGMPQGDATPRQPEGR